MERRTQFPSPVLAEPLLFESVPYSAQCQRKVFRLLFGLLFALLLRSLSFTHDDWQSLMANKVVINRISQYTQQAGVSQQTFLEADAPGRRRKSRQRPRNKRKLNATNVRRAPKYSTGILTKVDHEKQIGFITPDGGGKDIFVHAQHFSDGNTSLQEGNKVTYVFQFNPLIKKRKLTHVRLARGGDCDHGGADSGRPPPTAIGVLLKLEPPTRRKRFGFIRAESSGEVIYVSAANFLDGMDSWEEGARVSYVPRWNSYKKRHEALHVRSALDAEDVLKTKYYKGSSFIRRILGAFGFFKTEKT